MCGENASFVPLIINVHVGLVWVSFCNNGGSPQYQGSKSKIKDSIFLVLGVKQTNVRLRDLVHVHKSIHKSETRAPPATTHRTTPSKPRQTGRLSNMNSTTAKFCAFCFAGVVKARENWITVSKQESVAVSHKRVRHTH